MDLVQAIYQRRSVRHYLDRPVETATVHELIRAAVQAPSAMNQQPWAFGIITGISRLRGYSDRAKAHLLHTLAADFAMHPNSALLSDPDYNIFYNAGTLIVIYATRSGVNPAEDCCLAAQNLMLMAYGLGLASCPIGFARPWLDLPEVKLEMEVPSDYTVIFPVIVGYASSRPDPVPRHEPVVFQPKDLRMNA